MLEANRFYFNDATMQQSTFTSKLVSFFSQKLIMIADFEHSAKKWPVGEKLTKFLLIEDTPPQIYSTTGLKSDTWKTNTNSSSNSTHQRASPHLLHSDSVTCHMDCDSHHCHCNYCHMSQANWPLHCGLQMGPRSDDPTPLDTRHKYLC